MKDYSELKKLADYATPGPWVAQHPNAGQRGYEVASGDGLNQVCADLGPSNALYIATANPESVLELINEVEALKDQLECADEQLVFLEKQVKQLILESVSIKKDAARYRTIKKDSISDGSLIERLDCNVRPSEWDSYIDSVSVK